jgi:hypothetical protein
MKKLKLKIEGGPQLTENEMKKIFGSGQECVIQCCDANNGYVGIVNYYTCPTQSEADVVCGEQYYPQEDIRLCLISHSCTCHAY